MQRRHLATLIAAVTAVAAISVLLFTGNDGAQPASAVTATSIPQLPEQQPDPLADDKAVEALDRCIANAACTLVHTRAFSNAVIEIYQQQSMPPALHVRTVLADAVPSVWSLKDEHAATFKSMACGLANCLLEVVVSPEILATVDMRMVGGRLAGKIEGAAVGPALQTQAADLDQDGVLDLVTTQHLVRGDGTELLYYRTYVNEDRALVPTGCTIPSTQDQPPAELQVRICPVN